ncbi:hypothetical protein RY27_12860, partial [Litorilinea aerophila]
TTRRGERPRRESPADAGNEWRTCRYHLPPHLEEILQPGHLVWVPFGRGRVQGIVWQLADSAPVPTRPVERLARPLPVLTPVQLTLAAWLADYYVASILEVVRLFLPPGLLTRSGRKEQPRARRELQVTLAAPPEGWKPACRPWPGRRPRRRCCPGCWTIPGKGLRRATWPKLAACAPTAQCAAWRAKGW